MDDAFGHLAQRLDVVTAEIHGLRADVSSEMRDLRVDVSSELRDMRQSLDRIREVLIVAAFSMIGVLIAAIVAVIIAVA